jgi:hypothetical protein
MVPKLRKKIGKDRPRNYVWKMGNSLDIHLNYMLEKDFNNIASDNVNAIFGYVNLLEHWQASYENLGEGR